MTPTATPFVIAHALPVITPNAAHRAVAGAVAYATAQGWHINAAVVDRAGHLMAFLRMTQAPLHSIDIAIDKAFTSASFGLATSAWAQVLADDALLRQGLNVRPRLVLFGGGLPILDGDARIGGIGVSGASAEQDEACAAAGLKTIF